MSVRATRARKEPASDALIIDGVLDVDEVAEVIPYTYAITAYGADYPVDLLVRRLKEGDIFIPLFSLSTATADSPVRFQREYVWKKLQADRFIESLLLGLPVPGIFLVKEESGKHLVLDGHQRLQTLYWFYANNWEGGAFSLEAVQDRFKDRTYQQLEAADRRRLNDSVVHATIIRQDEPSEDLSSIYLIFERLNSGGTSLHPQEIRVALYHGRFVQLLSSLNVHASWRALFGRKSKRLKDIELILRFFALLESSKKYAPPMKGFLSSYMAHRRNLDPSLEAEFRSFFEQTSDAILRAIGPKAFKPKGTLNAAVVDAVMVGVARRITAKGGAPDPTSLKAAYNLLLRDESFQAAISRATANEENVKQRLKLATSLISGAE
ncbi:MAG: DUF262 domain-containing protein [Acidobacteriota bacterium]